MNRRFTHAIGIILLAAAAIFVFWEKPLVLSVLLLLIAYGKHKMFPIKSELLWFSLICLGGALIEILLVNFAGAWTYASSQLFDIPIWMPIFWGLVGTTVIVAYDGLTKYHK